MNSKFENKTLEVTGSEKHGFLMYVNGELMWFCDTMQDVYDQIEHAKDNGFFDENTTISIEG